MVLDQVAVIHFVDVVAGQDHDVLRPLFFERVDVLVNGVGGALIPVLVDPLLRRHDVDEFAQLAAQKFRQPSVMWRSRLIALYCVSTRMRRRPLLRQLESVKSTMR